MASTRSDPPAPELASPPTAPLAATGTVALRSRTGGLGRQMRRGQIVGGRILRAAWVPGVAAAFAVILARALPLTYDEAHNWMAFASQGTAFVTHNYPAPNNQVFFTLLQSLLPASWVRHDPLTLRLVNILVAVALVSLMESWLVRAKVPRGLAVAGLLLCGPLTVLYLGVARGYLLGTLLVFLGLHLLVGRGGVATRITAGGLFALAIYTIPTFAFGMVGVGALLLWRRRFNDLLVWGVAATAVALFLYGPIIHQVLDQTSRPFKHLPPQAPGAYLVGTVRQSIYLSAFGGTALSSAILAAAATAVAAAAAWQYRSQLQQLARTVASGRPWVRAAGVPSDAAASPSKAITIFQLLAAYAIGDLVLIEALHLFGHLDEPYYRNSLFIGWVVVLLLLRALRRGRWLRRAAAAVICANLLAGAIGVSLLVSGLDYAPARYGYVLVSTPPPALRRVASLGATSVRCSLDDTPACTIYAHYLARHGVRVTTTDWITDQHRCLTGWRNPVVHEGVLALRGHRELGTLCGR